jgi:hypothetical protein
MEIQFLNQPFDDINRLGSLFEEELPKAQGFWALSAWAQVSGLRLIEPHLRTLRRRNIQAELMIGIDGGIATKAALQLAIELFDSVHVFHDISDRVYHPKIYCIEGTEESIVVVGSSNLTAGGLYRNFEGNIVLRLLRSVEEDQLFLKRIRGYWDQFFIEGMPTRILNQELLEELENAGGLIVTDSEYKETEVIERVKRSSMASGIFGRRLLRLPSTPLVQKPAIERRQTGGLTPADTATLAEVSKPGLLWWKKLTRSDAMRKDSSSHQRNYVILGKASFSIDQKTWFRDRFFVGANWQVQEMRTGRQKEFANVPFEVFVDDTRLGTYTVRIDHAAHRVADQNNAPTWLNWSELLPLIRRQDFTDWYLVLEKRGESFRLILRRTQPQ